MNKYRFLREKNGYTIAALAREIAKTGVNNSHKNINEQIRRIENGQKCYDNSYIEAYCTIFDVSAEYLTGKTGTPSKKSSAKAINNYTGLSAEAVKILHKMKNEGKTSLDLLNFFIEKGFLTKLTEALGVYYLGTLNPRSKVSINLAGESMDAGKETAQQFFDRNLKHELERLSTDFCVKYNCEKTNRIKQFAIVNALDTYKQLLTHYEKSQAEVLEYQKANLPDTAPASERKRIEEGLKEYEANMEKINKAFDFLIKEAENFNYPDLVTTLKKFGYDLF